MKRRLLIISIISILLFLQSLSLASGALITCAVTIAQEAPFTTSLSSSDPDIKVGEEFEIVVSLGSSSSGTSSLISKILSWVKGKNSSSYRIRHAVAEITYDSSGLSLEGKPIKRLGTINNHNASHKSVKWSFTALKPGTYQIQVTITGEDENGIPVISRSDIEITIH